MQLSWAVAFMGCLAAAQHRCVADDTCEGSDSTFFQHKFRRVATEDAHKTMLQVIEDEFASLDGASGTLAGATASQEEFKQAPAVMRSWEACAKADYSSFSGLDDPKIKQLQRDVGLNELCGAGADACSAFNAGLKAMFRIRNEVPASARFQNFTLVNWYENENGFPSWGSDPNGKRVSVDTDVMPPVGAVHDPHAADGYAFCEITYTVLRQTASQFYNSCGPTSVLAALLVRSPVLSFKKALQLYYTGSLPEMHSSPCPYIFTQQPGLVPFEEDQPGANGLQGGDLFWCPDSDLNSHQVSKTRPQCQSIGLQRMWVVGMLAAYEHKVQVERTGGDKCTEWMTSTYPGESPQVALTRNHAFRTAPSAVVWVCGQVVGGQEDACYYASNFVEDCAPHFGSSVCTQLLKFQWSQTDLVDVQTNIETMGPGAFTEADATNLASRPTLKPIFKLVPGTSPLQFLNTVAPVVFQLMMTVSQSQEGKAKMWQKLCASRAAMLNMFSGALYGNAQPNCVHWIFLVSCKDDGYLVWSNGYRTTIAKDVLEASTCGGVVLP
ncbi:unnamed protein product [Symbiodinium sp. CCMP2592]|nr:unnamed protein product [Symbiodinium sp. CCMP2592]